MIIMIDPPAFHAKVLSESNNQSRESKMSETFRDLPPTFVHSMKKLFDYFDVDHSGRIPIATICSRWNPDKARAENLPPDLIRHLEKVTDRRGFLTFERFCAGLKIAILRHQPSPEKSSKEGSFSTDSSLNRTSSLPNLLNDEQDSSSGSSCGGNSSIETPVLPYIPPPPPKPPRYIYRSASRDSVLVLSTPSPSSPNTQSIQHNEDVAYVDISTVPTSAKSLRVMPPSYRLSHRFRRQNSRTRRHSVHAILESDVMTMVKKWEQERSLLEEGLRILDRVGRDYQDRLLKINHRLQNPYKGGESNCLDVEDKGVNYQKRVHNLNNAMSRLNSAVTEDENSNEELHRQIERLKDQNKLLTEEVSLKCCVISSMEREKSAIIKELFQSRSLVSQFSKKASGALSSMSIAEDSIMTFI
uniref:Suppressor APC domain-containing protein n=1 Tax=Lepeophtheirus salmonis TaxID=72036 RepID=A0A0K2TJY0_LEPSM